MSRIGIGIVVAVGIVAAACSGGSGGGAPVQSGLTAGFAPEQNAPGNQTVAMAQGTLSGDLVTVDVTVTDTNDVYGVRFDVTYDEANVTYEAHTPGTLLEQNGNGNNTYYDVDDSAANRLVVVATRQAPATTGADAAGTVPVIRLTFRVTGEGLHDVNLENRTVYDDQTPPQSMPISWFAGAISATAN